MLITTKVIKPSEDYSSILRRLNIYKWVGYQGCLLEFEYNPPSDYELLIENLKTDTKLQIYGKLLLRPKNSQDLREMLGKSEKYRNMVIGVESYDTDALSFAAHDTRVDLISVTSITTIKHLTPGIISLLKQNPHSKFLEISCFDAISAKIYQRSKIFREIHKVLNLTKKNQNLIVYGSAEQNNCLIRGPYEIKSILFSIFDIPLNIATKILRENPNFLIEKKFKRISADHIEPGVRIAGKISKQND